MKKRINPSPQLTMRQRFLRAATRWWILIGLWAMNYLSFAVIDATSWNPLGWPREHRLAFIVVHMCICLVWLLWVIWANDRLISEVLNPNRDNR